MAKALARHILYCYILDKKCFLCSSYYKTLKLYEINKRNIDIGDDLRVIYIGTDDRS